MSSSSSSIPLARRKEIEACIDLARDNACKGDHILAATNLKTLYDYNLDGRNELDEFGSEVASLFVSYKLKILGVSTDAKQLEECMSILSNHLSLNGDNIIDTSSEYMATKMLASNK